MARNTEPTGWRPQSSVPAEPQRHGMGWSVPPRLRLPLAIGAGITLVASAVVGAVGLSSSAQAGSAAQSAAVASAATTAATSADQNGLQALLDALFPPPAPPAPPAPPPAPPPEAPGTSLVADVLDSSVPVYANPTGGPVVNHIAGSNVLGQREALLVTDASVPGWYQVELPVKPNGSTGWVQASSVTTRTVTYFIRVHQSQFKLDLYNNGAVQQSFTVAVGAPSTPTPNGNFFVWATQDWNSAPYAVGIFALSGFSPVLDNWPGGGRTGIHGWQDTSILGTPASHGCVRMGPGDFAKLMHTIPLGTPVEITP
ncbi:MAG: ErfK/YbiS/YcfS/YnhG family protein [Actinobacteria bacterium]|nr:ErfK/YbiS/YcfS/YnhG family protein [Actinomycetota bacterium]MCW3044113.1 ErfK/YbiS/YcfS/YnhG family protein [Actinomycetota bacterium]